MNDTHKKKVRILYMIPIAYIAFALLVLAGVSFGIIPKSTPLIEGSEELYYSADFDSFSVDENLESAIAFLESELVLENGHVDLYRSVDGDSSLTDNTTNSEAISYYLLLTAQKNDKTSFDNTLSYMEEYMLEPNFDYMMWHIDREGVPTEDGRNIATDADLRVIKALLIAEENWGDERYTRMIDRLAKGLEEVGVTDDNYLAPYGGLAGETSTWTAKEVWLSYVDFGVIRELSERRGAPWNDMYYNMKEAVLEAQLYNGLYNSMLTEKREYGNGIDGGSYSINSMWIMVRNAESNDPELMESARKSLDFYKGKFEMNTELYAQYNSDGNALSPDDTAWTYALVGRAAVALGDKEFSEAMMEKLIEHQVTDIGSPYYGAIIEGGEGQKRVGQFTMQESIITLQDYRKKFN